MLPSSHRALNPRPRTTTWASSSCPWASGTRPRRATRRPSRTTRRTPRRTTTLGCSRRRGAASASPRLHTRLSPLHSARPRERSLSLPSSEHRPPAAALPPPLISIAALRRPRGRDDVLRARPAVQSGAEGRPDQPRGSPSARPRALALALFVAPCAVWDPLSPPRPTPETGCRRVPFLPPSRADVRRWCSRTSARSTRTRAASRRPSPSTSAPPASARSTPTCVPGAPSAPSPPRCPALAPPHLSGPPRPPNPAPPPLLPPQALYNLGVAHSEAGNPYRAAVFYHMTVMLQPGCAEAWNNLGVISKTCDTLAQSIEYFMARAFVPGRVRVGGSMAVLRVLGCRRIALSSVWDPPRADTWLFRPPPPRPAAPEGGGGPPAVRAAVQQPGYRLHSSGERFPFPPARMHHILPSFPQ